jgi:hypothetical protein
LVRVSGAHRPVLLLNTQADGHSHTTVLGPMKHRGMHARGAGQGKCGHDTFLNALGGTECVRNETALTVFDICWTCRRWEVNSPPPQSSWRRRWASFLKQFFDVDSRVEAALRIRTVRLEKNATSCGTYASGPDACHSILPPSAQPAAAGRRSCVQQRQVAGQAPSLGGSLTGVCCGSAEDAAE